MEYAIHLLALFIALNFLLKVGFYPRWGMWTVAAGYAFFAWLVTPWMTEQSKTVVAAFFASRPQMLNLSVCVTLEAAIMITSVSTVSQKCVPATRPSNKRSPSS